MGKENPANPLRLLGILTNRFISENAIPDVTDFSAP